MIPHWPSTSFYKNGNDSLNLTTHNVITSAASAFPETSGTKVVSFQRFNYYTMPKKRREHDMNARARQHRLCRSAHVLAHHNWEFPLDADAADGDGTYYITTADTILPAAGYQLSSTHLTN